MILRALVVFLLLLPVTACVESKPAPVSAKNINSTFGFSITIPDFWIPLTGEEIKSNPDLFDFSKVKGMSSDLLNQVVPLIKAGRVEIYFRPDGSSQFMDNVNVLKQVGSIPATGKATAAACKALPGELSKIFKKTTHVYQCKRVNVNGYNMLYLDFDGVYPGTRSMQYQIEKSPNVMLIMTATVKLENREAMSAEFDRMLQSVHLAQ